MDPANEEFKELLQKSGWNQSEAGRHLDLTSASVSRYVNDIDKPTKQTLRLFKIILAGTDAKPDALPEEAPRYGVETKSRAKELIIKIKELQTQLEEVLELDERKKINSKPLSESQRILKSVGDRYDAEHSSES